MKPKHLLLALLAVTFLFFTSCKKDKSDDEPPTETPQGLAAKILGKWQINTITVNDHFGGADHKKTYTGSTTDFVEFKASGQMHTFFQSTLDISAYKIKEGNVITIDDDPATVQEITESKLRLYTKDATGSFGFTEVIYDLKR